MAVTAPVYSAHPPAQIPLLQQVCNMYYLFPSTQIHTQLQLLESGAEKAEN